MKLVKFSVKNYRSITKAHDIPIMQTTVFLGRNNEGKSNLLKALSTAIETIPYYTNNIRPQRNLSHAYLRNRYRDEIYSWERDFPISLQGQRVNQDTVFRLEFSLNDSEIKEFKTEIKSSLNGTLPLEITLGKDKDPSIRVVKKGPSGRSLTFKSNKIADFINKRIAFNYIPTIRTHKEFLPIIEHLLFNELKTLNDNIEYKKAISTINKLREPLLKKLGEEIKKPLRAVRNVHGHTTRSGRIAHRIWRSR